MFNGIGGYEAVYLAIVILALVLARCWGMPKILFRVLFRGRQNHGCSAGAG